MGDMRSLGLHENAGSDTEDLLVTSVNARQLENCLGAAIVWREVDVRGQEARHATNVGFPYQCYSSPENDDEYPLLIHTRQAMDGYGSYHEPFVNGSSFYQQPAVEASGVEILKFQPDVKEEFGLNVDADIFEECLTNDGRDDEICDGISPENNGISVECPSERGGENSKYGKISGENSKYGKISGENCESLTECPNDQMTNAESTENIEIQDERKNEIASEIHKAYPNEKAVEDHVCVEKTSEKYGIECPTHQVVTAGIIEVNIPEECAKTIVRECAPCNEEVFLSAPTQIGQGTEQHVPLEINVKPKGRKSSRRKKSTGSRRRISRKISSQKTESVDLSADGIVDTLDLNNSEGLDALATPQIATIDTPLQSSSVVSSTEETNDGSNEVVKNLLADSIFFDKDTGISSNNKFEDKIIGRITRSRAHGKVYTRTLVHDSLLDKCNPIFANKMTGKRSVLCKTIRSTAWGGLENLRQDLKKRETAFNSELSCLDTEFGERKIIGEVIHNQQVTKRGIGARWQGLETNLEHHQSEQVKSSTVGSSRNFVKVNNDEPEKGLEGPGFVQEFGGPNEDISNAQRGELNFNEDLHSGGETLTQKDIEEENKCSGIDIDKCSTDQSKDSNRYLRFEVPRSLGYVEESTSHGELSELGRPNVDIDASHGDGWPTDVTERDQCSTDPLKCYLPHEVTETLRKEEEHNAFHEHLNESREAIIETVDHQTYKGKPRVGGGKRQKPRRISDRGESQQANFLVDDYSRHCRKKINEKQQKGLLQDQCYVIESSASEDHILNVQGGDSLCSSRDPPYGAGIMREENNKREQGSTEINKDRLSDVVKALGTVEEKNSTCGLLNGLCTTSIEDEIAQNQQWGKRETGVERQQIGKVCDIGQLEQAKYPVFSQKGTKRTSREGKVVICDSDSIVEDRRSDEHRPSVQKSDFLCLDRDLHSGSGIWGQQIIDEEHECLKCETDQYSMDQSKWNSRQDFSKSSIKIEDKNATQRYSSEETICTFINEAKSRDSSSIKMDASQEGYEESAYHIYDVRHQKNIASHEKLAAISVQEICGVSVDSNLKPLEECRTSTHAIVGTVLEMEKSDVNLGLKPSVAQDIPVSLKNSRYHNYIEQESALQQESLERNTVMLQDETRSCHNEIVTTDIDLKGCGLSGVSMEVADPLTTEHRDNELHDTISATSHDNIRTTFAKQESGKRKGNVKEKSKSKPKLRGTALGVAEVTPGGFNVSQDEHTVRKVTKSRFKKTVIRARNQGRKSNLKNHRSLLYPDGNDQGVVDEGLFPKDVEENSNCEMQETFNGEGMHMRIREESIANVKMETLAPRGKGQPRKNLKNCKRANIKTESMCSSVMCQSQRKATKKTKSNIEKTLSCGKSRQACHGVQSSTKSNTKPGKGLDSLLSKNGFSNQETSQGKAVSADLSGVKGQSDSCTDAASSLKLADTSANEEDKHGFSSYNNFSEEKNAMETYFPERQGMARHNNVASGEDVSSIAKKVEANRTLNMIKYDESAERCCGSPRVGWVACDDCQKWRCISAELIDAIGETNCKWTCQDNPNKEFADCSIAQEKSNAEINADLNISDASCEEGDCVGAQGILKYSAPLQAQGGMRDSHQAFWTLIKHNRILHRSRKSQAIDEIMVCHCKTPEDGSYGCGDECLNRMLNIECVKEACPCGDLCSNQQFQKRLYADVRLLRCGKKGFGLQVLQEVPKGLFIIEYVGEVLDMQAYNARQKEYASRGQRHFYFMTLDSNEVIDACVKGNLGRFINHSCDPNCRTEKWMVNGEVCIGLFAIRDIKKGEELTFDYNYVRVFGAAAKKCECSSAECKGFIGGDQSTPAIVVPSEPDDDYPVPVMLNEESENGNAQKNLVVSPKIHRLSDSLVPEGRSLQRIERKGQWTLDQHEKKVDLSSNSDIARSVGVPAVGNIPNMKKSINQTNLGRFEGVEEKLNEMLDSEGGISKRKDAAKHYLKLLLVTAASGNTSNGEACHSTRDLSMVLDALLKTRSRSVLIDIMNKNGLQMLHNMLKQNRNDFNKTPIIRKLLKVLEFLGTKDVLTIENINSDPVCRGRESFRASICALTGHSDWQVQQIARSFRDNWMPHPIKIFRSNERSLASESAITVSDHPNNRSKFSVKRQKNFYSRDTDAIDCTSQISPEPENSAWHPIPQSDQHEVSHDNHDNSPVQDSTKKLSEGHTFEGQMRGARPRKRKSRWDQPVESNVHQVASQMTLASGEGNIKHGKDSESLILPSDREDILGARHDALTKRFKISSEEKSLTIADKHFPSTNPLSQSAPPSHQPCEDMPLLNGSNTFVNGQSSFHSAMPQATQLPEQSQFCLGSKSTPLCPAIMPSSQPFVMGYPQGKVALGYAVGKPQGCILPYMPLSYGIPLSLLEQLGRTPNVKVGTVVHPLSPPPLHCEWNSNSLAGPMLPNIHYRPFIGQSMAGGFHHTLHHQMRPSNIPLAMQAAHLLPNGRRQPLEMHPRELLGQQSSMKPSYGQPEPPVPGLSPRVSSVNPQNSSRHGRGRSKTTNGQMLKPLKRQWKNPKSNFRTFPKFNGYSDRKYKDGFHPRKPLSFKSTWKGRFCSHTNGDQNLQHPPKGNFPGSENEQQMLENMNSANFSKGVSNNFPTFN